MSRRLSMLCWGAVLWAGTGCNFGLNQLNLETGTVDTEAVVDTSSNGGSDDSGIIGSWEYQTGSTLWTWTAGPTGGCGFSASDGNTSLGETCSFTADDASFTIETDACPGPGAYTYLLIGANVLQFTLIADPSCPDRAMLLPDGAWQRMW